MATRLRPPWPSCTSVQQLHATRHDAKRQAVRHTGPGVPLDLPETWPIVANHRREPLPSLAMPRNNAPPRQNLHMHLLATDGDPGPLNPRPGETHPFAPSAVGWQRGLSMHLGTTTIHWLLPERACEASGKPIWPCDPGRAESLRQPSNASPSSLLRRRSRGPQGLGTQAAKAVSRHARRREEPRHPGHSGGGRHVAWLRSDIQRRRQRHDKLDGCRKLV